MVRLPKPRPSYGADRNVVSLAWRTQNVTLAFISASDAGKTYWMGALACLTDQRGDTITSADFMWQECVDKALIYIPELALMKADQIEVFTVCEGQQTNINVKNKQAATLQCTPVLLTSNEEPCAFFTNEEAPIRNQMFLHSVSAYNAWSVGQGAANPAFFSDMFKLIHTMVENDSAWPYDLATESVQVLVDIVQARLDKMTKCIITPFTLLGTVPDAILNCPRDLDTKYSIETMTDVTEGNGGEGKHL